MKAACLTKPGVIEISEVDVPEIGSNEVLVKVRTTLTCGTDLKMFKRGHPFLKPPLIFGHEFAGDVAAVGVDVRKFREGMRIVAANSAPCNSCFFCSRGQQNLCEALARNIVGFSIPGAYAEFLRLPANIVDVNTYEIPSSLSYEEAALLEPLACVVHGQDMAQVEDGDSVAIIGAGPIGLLHLQVARRAGASKIIAVDLSEDRLEVARALGADHTIMPSASTLLDEVRKLTGERGVDVAIEAVGLPETWEQALAITRRGGKTLLFGGCRPETSISLKTERLHYDELTIKGSFHHTPRSVEQALRLIENHVINAKKMVSAEKSLREVPLALQEMADGRAVKVAIRPDL